jgi:signal transduction histidine kinase
VERRLNIEAEITAEGIEKLPGQVEENLFRIAIESLNNSLKYAQATKLHISFIKKKEKVIFRIKDNGTGFDVEKGLSKGGFGLAIMRERAERFGGKVNITSKPGSGTTVEVSFVTKG